MMDDEIIDLNEEGYDGFISSEDNDAVRLPSDLIQVLSYTITEMESGKFCHLHWAVAMEKIEEHPAWYRDLPSAEDIFDIAEYVTTTYRTHVIRSTIQKLREAGIDVEGLEGFLDE